MAKKLVNYVRIKQIRRVVIFYNSSAIYSSNLTHSFEILFNNKGEEFVRKLDLTNGEQIANTEVVLSELKNEADALILFPDPELNSVAIEIARTRKNLKSLQKKPLIGASALYGAETLEAGGAVLEDMILAVPWFPGAPGSKEFEDKAWDKWKGQVSWRTKASYDATQAFIEALSSSHKPSRSTVLEKLRSINPSGKEPVLVKVGRGEGGAKGSEFRFELAE